MSYMFITSRSHRERALIQAEALALTGGQPDPDGVIWSDTPPPGEIRHAAYVKQAMRVLAVSDSIEGLLERVALLQLHAERFRVSTITLTTTFNFNRQDLMRRIGALIEGPVDLDHPLRVFLVVMVDGRLCFGERIARADGRWQEHIRKPRNFSSALPTRIARAMVNLVAQPGNAIIDPCCGSGTIVIEAAAMGVNAVGCDVNPRIARAAAENVRSFGLPPLVLRGDATALGGYFDAVVTDLPYNRNSKVSESARTALFEMLGELAPKAAIVTDRDDRALLAQLGYSISNVAEVPFQSMSRFVHVLIADGRCHART